MHFYPLIPNNQHKPKTTIFITTIVAPTGVLAIIETTIPSAAHTIAITTEQIVTDVKLLNSCIAAKAGKIINIPKKHKSNNNAKNIIAQINNNEYNQNNIQGNKNEEPDLKPFLTNMNELFKYLNRKIEDIKLNCNYADEEEKKKENKENQELENVYIRQDVESNDNSEYLIEHEEVVSDLAAREQLQRNEKERPYTTNPSKTRSYINARDKMNK